MAKSALRKLISLFISPLCLYSCEKICINESNVLFVHECSPLHGQGRRRHHFSWLCLAPRSSVCSSSSAPRLIRLVIPLPSLCRVEHGAGGGWSWWKATLWAIPILACAWRVSLHLTEPGKLTGPGRHVNKGGATRLSQSESLYGSAVN